MSNHLTYLCVADLYAMTLGSCPSTDKLFRDIYKRVDRETRTMRQLMLLKGSLDLSLSGRSVKKPRLTCEERAIQEQLEERKDQETKPDLIMYRMFAQ